MAEVVKKMKGEKARRSDNVIKGAQQLVGECRSANWCRLWAPPVPNGSQHFCWRTSTAFSRFRRFRFSVCEKTHSQAHTAPLFLAYSVGTFSQEEATNFAPQTRYFRLNASPSAAEVEAVVLFLPY